MEDILVLGTELKTVDIFGISADIGFNGHLEETDADTKAEGYVSIPVVGDYNVQIKSIPMLGISLGSVAVSIVPGPSNAGNFKLNDDFTNAVVSLGETLTLPLLNAYDMYDNERFVGGDTVISYLQPVPFVVDDGNMTSTTVTDLKNGSYILTATFLVAGRYSWVIGIEGADNTGSDDVMGSPFEIFVVGPPRCEISDLVHHVSECSGLTRKSFYTWTSNSTCVVGAFSLPEAADIACDYVHFQSGVGIVVIVLASLCAMYSFVFILFILKYPDHWIVKFSQPLFCKLFLAGCVGLTGASVITLGPASQAICLARPWVVHFSLTFCISCLLVKIHRAYLLFNGDHGLRRVKVTNKRLLWEIMALCSVDIILLVLWFAIDPPVPRSQPIQLTYSIIDEMVCDNKSPFRVILWVYKAVLITVATSFAQRAWSLHDTALEAKPLAVVIYNIVVLGLINVALSTVGNDNLLATIVSCFSLNAGVCLSISVIFVPKYIKVKNNEQMSTDAAAPHKSPPPPQGKHSSNPAMSTGSTANAAVKFVSSGAGAMHAMMKTQSSVAGGHTHRDQHIARGVSRTAGTSGGGSPNASVTAEEGSITPLPSAPSSPSPLAPLIHKGSQRYRPSTSAVYPVDIDGPDDMVGDASILN